jgi:hypothetical protein
MTKSAFFGKINSTLIRWRPLEGTKEGIMPRKPFWIALLFVLLFGMHQGGSLAQQRPTSIPPSPRSPDDNGAPPNGPSRNLKMMKESFEQTQKDTAQLYDLATQLKDEVDKADENTLSLAVMKKAETIEKLAEKIKNRMKNL